MARFMKEHESHHFLSGIKALVGVACKVIKTFLSSLIEEM